MKIRMGYRSTYKQTPNSISGIIVPIPEPELGLDELRALRNLAEDSYERFRVYAFCVPSDAPYFAKKLSKQSISRRDRTLTLVQLLTTIIERKDTSRKLGTQS